MSRPGVANPDPGEPQGVLAFFVTQQLIDQLKQLITQLTHFIWFLDLNWLLVKPKASTPCGSPGQGLATPGLDCISDSFNVIFIEKNGAFL